MATPIINEQMDAINESFEKISSDLTTIRPLLKNASIGAYPTDSASGSIASFTDGADDVPVKELKVNLEPVQDLNGYDNPWPAGGGKNKFPTATATSSGAQNIFNNTALSAPSGTYTLSFTSNSARTKAMSLNFGLADNTSVAFSVPSTDSVATFTANAAIVKVTWYVREATDIKDIQLESGSTRTAYAPYSNICPISGHTKVNVTRTGKNWVDTAGRTVTTTSYPANLKRIRKENCSATKSGDTLVCTDLGAWAKVRYGIIGSLVVGQEYTLSAHFQNPDGRTVLVGILRGNGWVTSSSSTATSADMKYTFVYDGEEEIGLMVNNTASAKTGTVTISNIQLELGSTATAYEPYAGQTYPIPLGQTVYGGTLNVMTGVLTVDRAMVTLNGSESWSAHGSLASWFYLDSVLDNSYVNPNKKSFAISNKYIQNYYSLAAAFENGQFGIGLPVGGSHNRLVVKDTAYTTVAQFKSALETSPLQVCYELATPTAVQLTATQVSTLLGTNNIWADAGEMEVKVASPVDLTNPTNFPAKPLIRVYGNGSVRVGDTIATVQNNADGYVDIDCELMDCFRGTTNLNADVTFSGNDFPVLNEGSNNVTLGSGITQAIITPRWWEL